MKNSKKWSQKDKKCTGESGDTGDIANIVNIAMLKFALQRVSKVSSVSCIFFNERDVIKEEVGIKKGESCLPP